MKITRLAAIRGGITLGGLAGSDRKADRQSIPTTSCPPMMLAIAFTNNVSDTSRLHPRLPWGHPGDPEGRIVEDYGSYDSTTIREHLPVHDVTTGTLQELFGHNAIDIVRDSGTPLYGVTSGTAYRMTNWTIPGGPQGYPLVVVSDVLKDDQGDAIAFLYAYAATSPASCF